MDIKQLRYFVEVARRRSFTAAAAALYVTQPALSRQIADLEDELGEVLFDRSTRRIAVTEKGAMLFRRAEKILEMVQRARDEVMKTQELAGELTIAAAETPVMQMVADVVARFTEQYPGVRVQLQSSNAVDAALSLKMGTADFGVFNLPADLNGLDFFVLPEQNRWGLMTRRDGIFAGHESVQTKELSGVELYVPRQKALQNLWAGRMRQKALQNLWAGRMEEGSLRIRGTYNLLYNASLLVRSGAHVLCIGGILPEDDDVMFLPLQPILTTEVAVAWPPLAIKSPLTQLFLKALNAAVDADADKVTRKS